MTEDRAATTSTTPTGPDPAGATKPRPTDLLVASEHTLRLPDGELAYTARTGRLVLGEEETADGEFKGVTPRAELGVTAYTVATEDPTSRPITFVFNGGPGAASVWLHLGLMGPRRVECGDAGNLIGPPARLVDNPDTLLTVTDLVFIDPVSTGQSRVVEGGSAKDLHAFGKDVEQVAELIRLWLTREERWLSPTYLAGESYGTVRATAVALRLQEVHQLALSGLILISSCLDFGGMDFHGLRTDDLAYRNYLPTYAAVAWYHGKHPDRSLADVVAEAEEFAGGRYWWLLDRGNRLTPDERAEGVATIARLTGLSEDYVERADLRIEHWRFCGELLRDEGLAVGRIDARFTGPLASRIAEHMDADVSMDALMAPYGAAMKHYLRHELGWRNDLAYRVISSDASREWQWDEMNGKPINVADRLERLMRANPFLRTRIEYGWFDLATPYYAACDVVAHLRLPDGAAERIEHAWFETGHMPYLHAESRKLEADGLKAFIAGPTGDDSLRS